EVGGRGAAVAAGLHDHVVLLAVLHEGGDPAPAHHRLQRAPDVGDAGADVGGTPAVDVHAHLRAGLLVVGIHREEARVLLHPLHHDVAPLRDLGVFGPAEHDLHRLAAAADQAAAHARLRAHAGEPVEVAPQRLGDLGGGLLALRPVLQEHDDVAGVHLLARAPAAGRAGVVAADRAALAEPAGEDLLDLPHLPHGVVETGALWADDGHEERAAVLGRRQLRGHHFHQPPAREAGQHHQPADQPGPAQRALQPALVGVGHARQPGVDPAVQAGALLLAVRTQQ